MSEKKNVTLKLDSVSKSFAKVEADEVTHALNNVSLTMESGEFISLVGPSGCGKSTILRLVAGLITPTAGTVTVDGNEITGPSPERGMVFQKPTLFPWLTVEKNIGFSLAMQGKLKGNEDKVDRMISVIGLEKFKDDYPGSSPAVWPSVWHWSAPSSMSRISYCWTSLWAHWTPLPA